MDKYEALSQVTSESEVKTDVPHTKKNSNEEKKLLHMWIYSIIVSAIPLVSIPVYLAITNGDVWKNVFDILSGSEIVFVGVSLTTISTNDISNFSGRKQRWIKANQLMVIIGALMYGMMSIAEYEHPCKYNSVITLIFNIIFLFFTIVLGVASYTKD